MINALAHRNYHFLERAYHNFQSIFSELLKRTGTLQSNR